MFLLPLAHPIIIGDSIVHVTAEKDSEVSLPCSVEGHPTPWITWEKDGEFLPSNIPSQELDGFPTLEIPDVKKSNSGVYKCHAKNAAGNVTIVFILEVHGELAEMLARSVGYGWLRKVKDLI